MGMLSEPCLKRKNVKMAEVDAGIKLCLSCVENKERFPNSLGWLRRLTV